MYLHLTAGWSASWQSYSAGKTGLLAVSSYKQGSSQYSPFKSHRFYGFSVQVSAS